MKSKRITNTLIWMEGTKPIPPLTGGNDAYKGTKPIPPAPKQVGKNPKSNPPKPKK